MNPLMPAQPPASQGQPPQAPSPSPENLASAIQHNEFMGNMLTSLLMKQDVSIGDVLKGMADAIKNGSITAQQAAAEAVAAPSDKDGLIMFLKDHLAQNMEVGRRLNLAMSGQAPQMGGQNAS